MSFLIQGHDTWEMERQEHLENSKSSEFSQQKDEMILFCLWKHILQLFQFNLDQLSVI